MDKRIKEFQKEEIKNTNALIIAKEDYEIDVLDRKPFIDGIKNIIEYYANKRQKVSFAIQGIWGSGKSWIINKICNEIYDIQDFENLGSKYCILTYNSWDFDYYDEPLISLFISIYKQLNNENSILIHDEKTRIKVNAFFDTLKDKFIEELQPIPFIGNIINFKQAYDNKLAEFDDRIRKYDYHFDINQIMESTIKGLNKISIEKTIVLFIDELDRCLPEYAVKVLERIHHIKQYVNNIIIIYSLDKGQLKQTITQFFDKSNKNTARDYFSKFIDFSLDLPPVKFNEKIEEKYSELFDQFGYINCNSNTDINKLFNSLLPKSIPIRILQNMIKKINFINNQLNTKGEKMDYSILITELFIAIAEELEIKWEGTYFQYDNKKEKIIIGNQNQYIQPNEIYDFIETVACTGIYQYGKTKDLRQEKWWLIMDKDETLLNALILYYIARLLNLQSFYSFIPMDYLSKNEEYLKQFLNFYKLLKL